MCSLVQLQHCWAGLGCLGWLGWLRPIAIVKQSSRQNNWAQDLGLTNAAFDGEFLFRYRSSARPRWCREGEILQIPAPAAATLASVLVPSNPPAAPPCPARLANSPLHVNYHFLNKIPIIIIFQYDYYSSFQPNIFNHLCFMKPISRVLNIH